MAYRVAWCWRENQEKPDYESGVFKTVEAARKEMIESIETLCSARYLDVEPLAQAIALKRAEVAGVGDRVPLLTTKGTTLDHWIAEF